MFSQRAVSQFTTGTGALFPVSADTQSKVDMIADRLKNDPPADQAYQEYNLTTAAASQTQSFLDDLQKRLTYAESIEPKYKKQLLVLAKQAETCPKDFKDQLGSLTPESSDGFSLTFRNGDQFQAYTEAMSRLRGMSSTEMCKEVKKLSNSGGDLTTSLEESLTQYKKELGDQNTYTSKLLALYKEHASKIQGKLQGQHATNVLAGQLPILVGIVCLFSLCILAILKFIGSELIQMELVKSGQIIQFPMVMILLVVIISLGMSDKLTESSLSALLGGLAGYVLSQGVGSMASQRARAVVPVNPNTTDSGDTPKVQTRTE